MPSARKQTIAQLYFKPTGTGGYLNAGDVASYKFAPEIKYAEWSRAAKGSRTRRARQPYEMHWRWQFHLNEQLDQTMKLLRLASAATVVQAAAVAAVWPGSSFVPDEASTYNLPHTWLTSYLYTGDGTPVEGVDYTVDTELGQVSTLTTFWIDFSLSFSLVYSAPAILSYTALKSVRATGAFKILEFDQFSEVPRLTHTFDGQAQIIAAPENDAGKPAEYELEVTASGLVTTKKRAA